MRKLDIELFIFDLDGTLIDSKTDIAHSVNYTLGCFNIPALEYSLIYSYVGNGVTTLLEKSLTSTNKNIDTKDALRVFLKHYGDHLLDNTFLYPNVMETLKYFSEANMVLISNKPEKFIKKTLKGLNIDRFFPLVLGGDTLKTKKPEPEGINIAMNKYKSHPEKTVIVGDSGIDIDTGKRVGIQTCGVSYGLRDRAELVKAGADFIIDDIWELKDLYKWKKEN